VWDNQGVIASAVCLRVNLSELPLVRRARNGRLAVNSSSPSIMMKRETVAIADMPIKRRTTLEQKRVDAVCWTTASGRRSRFGRTARFVLVDGLHRLEAAKALGKNRRRPSCLRVEALNSRLLHRSRTGPSSRVSNEPVQIKN
jgi:sulfiredoxin